MAADASPQRVLRFLAALAVLAKPQDVLLLYVCCYATLMADTLYESARGSSNFWRAHEHNQEDIWVQLLGTAVVPQRVSTTPGLKRLAHSTKLWCILFISLCLHSSNSCNISVEAWAYDKVVTLLVDSQH